MIFVEELPDLSSSPIFIIFFSLELIFKINNNWSWFGELSYSEFSEPESILLFTKTFEVCLVWFGVAGSETTEHSINARFFFQ